MLRAQADAAARTAVGRPARWASSVYDTVLPAGMSRITAHTDCTNGPPGCCTPMASSAPTSPAAYRATASATPPGRSSGATTTASGTVLSIASVGPNSARCTTPSGTTATVSGPVSYTHLRAHETRHD